MFPALTTLLLLAAPTLARAEAPPDAVALDDSAALDEFEDDFFGTDDDRSSKKKGREKETSDPGELGGGELDDDDPDWDDADPLLDDGDPDEGLGDPPLDDDPLEDFGGDPDGDFGGDPDEDPDDGLEGDFEGDPDDFGGDPGLRDGPEAAAPASAAPAGPTRGLGLKLEDVAPLSDAFDLTVVTRDIDAVVVELPVLVATSATSHKDAEFWLIVEARIGEQKVGEQRTWISAQTVADLGPTVVWSKLHIPVVEESGEVRLTVSRMESEGEPVLLYERRGAYSL